MAIDSAKQKTTWLEAERLRISKRFELGVGFETMDDTSDTAISVELPITYLDSTTAGGAIAGLTLANGYEGQVKVVILIADGGDCTLTPANFFNGTTILFDDNGDMWMGIFHAGNWYSLGTPTATVS